MKIKILKICKFFGLFYISKFLSRNKLSIFCYHGFSILDEDIFRPKLFISTDKFQKRLSSIRDYGFNVIPLSQAVTQLYSRELPNNSIAITIDDGFHSVAKLAAPILNNYKYPSTVYLATYYVLNNKPIFRLIIQYMFWKTKNEQLLLQNCRWSDDCVVMLNDFNEREVSMWKCINYGELKATEEIRCLISAELGELLQTPYQDIVESRILHLMTPEELKSLSGSNMEVELHTHRHIFPDDESLAKREIDDNRAALKEWFLDEKTHFCYPSGLWGKHQWKWLDRLRVKSATTCLPGLNTHKTPRHALRRFLDGENIHQIEFEATLCGFTDLLRGWRGS
jgi:peptidoglycan/xylan/chitin deacetylase (PgdA/CDA1 family)